MVTYEDVNTEGGRVSFISLQGPAAQTRPGAAEGRPWS